MIFYCFKKLCEKSLRFKRFKIKKTDFSGTCSSLSAAILARIVLLANGFFFVRISIKFSYRRPQTYWGAMLIFHFFLAKNWKIAFLISWVQSEKGLMWHFVKLRKLALKFKIPEKLIFHIKKFISMLICEAITN